MFQGFPATSVALSSDSFTEIVPIASLWDLVTAPCQKFDTAGQARLHIDSLRCLQAHV